MKKIFALTFLFVGSSAFAIPPFVISGLETKAIFDVAWKRVHGPVMNMKYLGTSAEGVSRWQFTTQEVLNAGEIAPCRFVASVVHSGPMGKDVQVTDIVFSECQSSQ